jgi:hypothetical protein
VNYFPIRDVGDPEFGILAHACDYSAADVMTTLFAEEARRRGYLNPEIVALRFDYREAEYVFAWTAENIDELEA